MHVDLLEVAYCEGWDSLAGAMTGPLSTALAQERDQAGEQYAVLLSAASGPVALIEVARGEQHYGLRVFGAGRRAVSEVSCRLLDEDAPRFGDWGRFLHSFPSALSAAGLTVPATAALFDVSAPDAAGLAPGERALAPDPAYLGRLFTPGTRLTFRTRDNAEHATVEVTYAGELVMKSGRVVAKDPTWFTPVDPFTVAVAPGEYRVLLSVARFDDSPEHARVAAAKLVISDAPARTWEMALLPGQDPRLLGNEEFYGFGVDAGTGCFHDDSASEAFGEIEFDILEERLTASVTDPESGANLIAYSSGWGDGSYPTWIGRGAAGDVTCFVSDMLLVPDTED